MENTRKIPSQLCPLVGTLRETHDRLTFQREGSERRRDHANMEHFYYTAIYQALNTPTEHAKSDNPETPKGKSN